MNAEIDTETAERIKRGNHGISTEFRLPNRYHWARGVSRGPWCLVDNETRRTLCERHSEPLNTQFAPEADEVPASVCEACARAAPFLEGGRGQSPEDSSAGE